MGSTAASVLEVTPHSFHSTPFLDKSEAFSGTFVALDWFEGFVATG